MVRKVRDIASLINEGEGCNGKGAPGNKTLKTLKQLVRPCESTRAGPHLTSRPPSALVAVKGDVTCASTAS